MQTFSRKQSMHPALNYQSNSLRGHCVFHRQTCGWPTQPPAGIAHGPQSVFRQSRQFPAGAARLIHSRFSAAKSNLKVPAVTSVEGRILTVHYLRRNEDVQVRPSEGLCINVMWPRQRKQCIRVMSVMHNSHGASTLTASFAVVSHRQIQD